MCFKRRKVKKKRGGSQRFQKGEKPKILIYIQKLSKFQSYSKRNTTLENRNRHRGGGNFTGLAHCVPKQPSDSRQKS